MRDSRVERIRVIAVAFAATLSSTLVHGGGSTDGSVGAVQNLSGNFAIPESLGAVRGSNLFHSFSRFNVDFGESATFTTTSSNLQNVISRVTGGQVSTIHGILKLQAAPGSAPAFYFVNPAGVVFGAGAVIDVPSSFHVSTAQSIKFGDGFIWNTGSANQSSLTIAPPEAFGFLGSRSAAPVAIDTSKSDPAELTQRLELTPNSTLSIAAGDIQVGSRIIAIPGGKLRLSSTGADTVDVPVSHSQANPPPLSGPLTVSGASICADAACSIAMQSGGMRFQGSSIGVLDKDGVPGGSISFRGADITLDNSRVFSATTSNSNAKIDSD